MPAGSAAVIATEGLTFAYPGAPTSAVNDVTFAVEPGEIFGFLGPSGAGKSTTQKLLIRLLREYEGRVSVLGKDLSQWDGGFYEKIGVSFESPNHYLKLTGIENLTYFSQLYSGPTESPQSMLEAVGLGGDGAMLVGQYSKGMKNRLSVARSLLHRPQLLFMDEPTAGLDPVNARNIKNLIKEQQKAGRTIFLSTHDMTVADELCTRLAFIVDGNIRLIDTPHNLKLRYGQRRVRVEVETPAGTEMREFALDGLGDNAEFVQVLRSHPVQTIHTLEATLDDIFIQVTGRSLT